MHNMKLLVCVCFTRNLCKLILFPYLNHTLASIVQQKSTTTTTTTIHGIVFGISYLFKSVCRYGNVAYIFYHFEPFYCGLRSLYVHVHFDEQETNKKTSKRMNEINAYANQLLCSIV